MTTLTYRYPNPFTASRARDREAFGLALAALSAEYPHYTMGELIDCLIESQHDLETARGLINQSVLNQVPLSEYLASIAPEGPR